MQCVKYIAYATKKRILSCYETRNSTDQRFQVDWNVIQLIANVTLAVLEYDAK